LGLPSFIFFFLGTKRGRSTFIKGSSSSNISEFKEMKVLVFERRGVLLYIRMKRKVTGFRFEREKRRVQG
jgi:hypothetical protein